MILLGLGAEMLAQLMRADAHGPDSAWLLAGSSDPAVVDPFPEAEPREDWPLAAE